MRNCSALKITDQSLVAPKIRPRSHKSRHRIAVSAIVAVATLASPILNNRSADAKPNDRPNIVVIMADDMGYSDIGCYGSEIQTPNLDQLAADGIRFTQFYNTARCCPTRASLMSGLYPHQAGVGHMMYDAGLPGYRGNLNRRCMTIAEVLKTAGYSTYMAGKWHIARHISPDGPKENWPRQRGYDRFFGTIHGAGSFFDPNSLTRDNTQIVPGEDFYYTDAISKTAAGYVRDHQRDEPFFMYVAYTAPHWPMHARPRDIKKYEGKYKDGWGALRKSRYKRMVEMGLIDPQWKLSPGEEPWESAQNQVWQQRRMEVYAAMIDSMDQGIGRIVESLTDTKKLDNTLIMFIADNGGCAEEYGSRGSVRPAKLARLSAMGKNELQTRMQPSKTRDGRPVRTGFGVMPGPADTYIAYGKQWANASNTPFRMYKHWVHEGGILSPLVAHWPKGIKEMHGKFESQPAHLIDIMATCVDLSRATYPAKYKDVAIQPLEGVSLAPSFVGQPLGRKDAIYFEHEGNRAVRLGKWKLVSKHNGPWELYDMVRDRSELRDLAKTDPSRTEKMVALYDAWAKRAGVEPWPVRKKKKKKG